MTAPTTEGRCARCGHEDIAHRETEDGLGACTLRASTYPWTVWSDCPCPAYIAPSAECEACENGRREYDHIDGEEISRWISVSHATDLHRELAEARELIKQLHESGDEWMRCMAEEGSPLDLLTKRTEDFLARRALGESK